MTLRTRLKRIHRNLTAVFAAIFLLASLPQLEVHDHSAFSGDIGALVQHLATEHRSGDDAGMHVHDGSLSGVVALIDGAATHLAPGAALLSSVDDRLQLPPGALLPYSLHRPPEHTS